MMSALRQGGARSKASAAGEACSGSQNRAASSSLPLVFLEGRNEFDGNFRTHFFGESAKIPFFCGKNKFHALGENKFSKVEIARGYDSFHL